MKIVGVLLAVLISSGCDVGLGRSVVVVNDSSEPLFEEASGDRLSPRGGTWNYGMQGCSESALVFLDKAGDVFAEIDSGWCTEETWTITERGEVTLTEQR